MILPLMFPFLFLILLVILLQAPILLWILEDLLEPSYLKDYDYVLSFVTYDHLAPSYKSFVLNVGLLYEP